MTKQICGKYWNVGLGALWWQKWVKQVLYNSTSWKIFFKTFLEKDIFLQS